MRNNCIDVKYGIDVETPQDLRASGMIKDKKKLLGSCRSKPVWPYGVNGSFLYLSKNIYILDKKYA